eukprot:gene16757-18451_t
MAFVNKFSQSFYTHARLWYLIDAKDQVNGRLAGLIGQLLQGKTKPIFHPSADVGDHVVVINTKDIVLSGKKWDQKLYRHHTGYPGGLIETKAKVLHQRDPTIILWRAVYGMLPKNKLRMKWMKRLYLFDDDQHPFAENIYAKVDGGARIPKRLSEYTQEELEEYPKLY